VRLNYLAGAEMMWTVPPFRQEAERGPDEAIGSKRASTRQRYQKEGYDAKEPVQQ